MKHVKTLTLLCLSVLLVRRAEADISDVELEMILSNEKYVLGQLRCVTNENDCDDVGRKFKMLAPLVLLGSCREPWPCTETDIRQIKIVLAHLQRHHPKEMVKLLKALLGS